MRFVFRIVCWLLLPSAALAQPEVDIGIRSSFAQRIPLVISPFAAVDGTSRQDATMLEQQVFADLEFTGIFKIQRGRAPQESNGEWDDLVEVRGALLMHKGEAHFEGRVIDTATGQAIGAKRYVFKQAQIRPIAHHFADEVVRMLTGERGIATTRIMFRRQREGRWEVVMCDYDGYNPRVLIRQSVPILHPRWIDQSKGLVYTSFRKGSADLYLRYLTENESKPIASYEGLNYSADWSEKRGELVVTLSKDGNPELYLLATDGQVRRRLTHNRAIDVSPCWSPSGREIVFTSDRLGVPHIFIMEADGTNVRRLTFHGNYNESPAWSPRGDLIAFVSRIDGFFQLCTIRPDGSDLRVITGEAFDHEDPRWAPNSRHLVCSEKRGGESVISIIDIFTRGKRILSAGETPDWSAR